MALSSLTLSPSVLSYLTPVGDESILISGVQATLTNTFRNSQKTAGEVDGFWEFVEEADRRLNALGRTGLPAGAAQSMAVAAAVSPERLDIFIARVRAELDRLESAPVMRDLELSPDLIRAGQQVVADFTGELDGSTIEVVPPDGLELLAGPWRLSGVATTPGEYTLVITETNEDALNSPHVTTLPLTVLRPPAVDQRVTLGRRVRLGNRTIRLNGLIPGDDRPRLSVDGPGSITEGNPSNDKPALALDGPSSLLEGNPPTGRPALNVTGPSSMTEGNP